MKLIGPWFSGPTRRVGITLKLLDIPFEHLALHAYLQRDEVRKFSPMGKVPALVIGEATTMFDSGHIIDYLHEIVGPDRALLAASGPLRHEALHHIGIADAIYGKLLTLYDESLRAPEHRDQGLTDGWIKQVLTGFTMLEAATGDGWLVDGKLSQADIFVVIVYQGASLGVLPDHVDAQRFPRLAALTERAMQLPAFAETNPFG
ncbi:glutathione S-transferase family protein [Paraburkholderia tropica]|uniref:glutathione S-transferase family protein n=1 Tax=Paraburkholderia tropica TaxID=92647 RepID=UPI002ABE1E2F|nr:glutathione S-transferase family protein [Paraburkholderia tropica]